MHTDKTWTVRLAGSCQCFREKDETGNIIVAEQCELQHQCSIYAIWSLINFKSKDTQPGIIPPLQIPFTAALMKSGLFTRPEIISALCEVFQVQTKRANGIYFNATQKLKESGIECIKSDDGRRYLSQ